MTYIQQNRRSHEHRWFVDANTGDTICMCGKEKGKTKESTTAASKYRNIPSEYKGIICHSRFEAEYAAELDTRIRLGEITHWERQVKLEMRVNGYHICNYYIDFVVHHKDGSREFTEIKGLETAEWKMKWKLLESMFDDLKAHPDDRMTLVKQVKGRLRLSPTYPQKPLANNAKRPL